jgi:uncharacterized protein
MPALKVVLDTNVLISGAAYPRSIPGKIMAAWVSGQIQVTLSNYILDELRRTLPRLRAQHGLSDAEIEIYVDSMSFLADIVVPMPTIEPRLTDPNDQAILGTLLATRDANYLITGDKALLTLSDEYAICTPADFWAKHGVGGLNS